MLYKRIGLIALMLLGMIGVVEVIGTSYNIFNDGTTGGNITFDAAGDSIKYINITQNGFIKNITIELTGFNTTDSVNFLSKDTEDEVSVTLSSPSILTSSQGGVCNVDTGNLSYDEDENSACGINASVSTNEANFTENFTISNNVGLVNMSVKGEVDGGSGCNAKLDTSCWSYSSNSWSGVKQRTGTSGSSPLTFANILPDECINSSKVQVLNRLYFGDAGNCNFGADVHYFETKLFIFNKSLIQNLTININSTRVYENLTNINGSLGKVDLNASVINSLCSSLSCWLGLNFSSKKAGKLEYFNLNITQNNQPNATNVSITPLPITAGNALTGHCNYSDSDNDQAGGNQTYWYINRSVINTANNSFSLLGGNVTELANITFSCRYNDTYDWSNWINSSTANVGDATSPTINSFSINSLTFTTGTINITANVTDALSSIDFVRATIDGVNQSMSLLGDSIYQFTATAGSGSFGTGQHNISYFIARDSSSNIQTNSSTINFTISAASGGSS